MRLFTLLTFLIATLCSGMAAQSYIIVDNQTGHILDSSERDEKRQVASLTKVATAMVALDWAQLTKADLGQMAPITTRALGAGGSNPVGLQEGDLMSLRDLVYASLISSDNVAATALAQYVGGRLQNPQGLAPVENFVSHMNALAKVLGMKKTLFLNPSGYDGNSQDAVPYSTASDMARLTRYAYSEADFPFYVAQKSRVVHVMRGGIDTPVELTNTNSLLGSDGIDGVKTGATSKAGECLILSAERTPEVKREGETVLVTPRRLIVVLLGSRNRFGEGTAFLQQGWSHYDQWAAGGRKVKGKQTL